MGEWFTLQFSVALFAGMAMAMIVPPVRRSVPRWMEAIIWLGLIVTCLLAIANLQRTSARFLTESAAWGADQIVNTSIGLMMGSVLGWISDHRFVIANAVVTLAGADILLLALLRSHRKAVGWQPRILLGEWIEVPLYRTPASAPLPVAYALDEWNRRAERAIAMLGAAILTWLDRAALGDANLTMLAPDGVMTDEQLVNIRALLRAQSIGWYGPAMPAPPSPRVVDRGEGEGSGTDRLAS